MIKEKGGARAMITGTPISTPFYSNHQERPKQILKPLLKCPVLKREKDRETR